MSTCDITSGFSLGCRDNTGGVNALYILSGSVDTVTAADGVISDLDGTGTFYKFELFRQTSDFTETLNSTPENGTVFYEQTLNAMFHKMQSSVRNQVKILASNPNLKIIVETNNGSADGVGKFWYLGEGRGLQLTSGTAQTGTAFGDMNGYSLTFVGQEPSPAQELGDQVLLNNLTGIAVG